VLRVRVREGNAEGASGVEQLNRLNACLASPRLSNAPARLDETRREFPAGQRSAATKPNTEVPSRFGGRNASSLMVVAFVMRARTGNGIRMPVVDAALAQQAALTRRTTRICTWRGGNSAATLAQEVRGRRNCRKRKRTNVYRSHHRQSPGVAVYAIDREHRASWRGIVIAKWASLGMPRGEVRARDDY
jgi:hypothetical protein